MCHTREDQMAPRHWRAVRRLATITVTGALAVAAVASPAVAGTRLALIPGWPQLQGNPAHTGFEPGETSVTPANVGQLTQSWTAAMPGAAYFSDITVTNGTLYIAQGGSVVALNAATGARVWQTSFLGTVETTPAVQGGRVLVQWDPRGEKNEPRHCRSAQRRDRRHAVGQAAGRGSRVRATAERTADHDGIAGLRFPA